MLIWNHFVVRFDVLLTKIWWINGKPYKSSYFCCAHFLLSCTHLKIIRMRFTQFASLVRLNTDMSFLFLCSDIGLPPPSTKVRGWNIPAKEFYQLNVYQTIHPKQKPSLQMCFSTEECTEKYTNAFAFGAFSERCCLLLTADHYCDGC